MPLENVSRRAADPVSRFAVQLTRAAAKDLDSLPSEDRNQVSHALRTLEESPIGGPPRIKRLKGFPFALYRLRYGDYRVLYRVDENLLTLTRTGFRLSAQRPDSSARARAASARATTRGPKVAKRSSLVWPRFQRT